MKRNSLRHGNVFKNEKSLYDTFYAEYKAKKPFARIVYLAKIKQPESQQQQASQKKKDKEVKPELINNFIMDLKSKLQTLSGPSNVMIIFVGDIYAFVGVENTIADIESLIKFVRSGSQFTEDAHVIVYNEECPTSMFPVWYQYLGEVYEKDNQFYKDMTSSEKGYALYDNFFCNFGRSLKELIHNENDFKLNEGKIKEEEVKFVKYHPSMNEVEIFFGEEYPSIEQFISLYFDEMEIDFDDDLVYPYYWPLNV
jgi:hypothetical protein